MNDVVQRGALSCLIAVNLRSSLGFSIVMPFLVYLVTGLGETGPVLAVVSVSASIALLVPHIEMFRLDNRITGHVVVLLPIILIVVFVIGPFAGGYLARAQNGVIYLVLLTMAISVAGDSTDNLLAARLDLQATKAELASPLLNSRNPAF